MGLGAGEWSFRIAVLLKVSKISGYTSCGEGVWIMGVCICDMWGVVSIRMSSCSTGRADGRDGQLIEAVAVGRGAGDECCISGEGWGCGAPGEAFRFPRLSVAMIPAEVPPDVETSCTYISA